LEGPLAFPDVRSVRIESAPTAAASSGLLTGW
jgi:hypothetical protein